MAIKHTFVLKTIALKLREHINDKITRHPPPPGYWNRFNWLGIRNTITIQNKLKISLSGYTK
jgi:hypothetical protein